MSDKTEVSVALGYTLNLGNFQSLRIDLGVKDWTRNNETVDQAMERIYSFVEQKLITKIEESERELKEP